MPAISWPMTAGWPIRVITSPRTRPQTSRAMISARNTTSEGPCVLDAAAQPAFAANEIAITPNAKMARHRQ